MLVTLDSCDGHVSLKVSKMLNVVLLRLLDNAGAEVTSKMMQAVFVCLCLTSVCVLLTRGQKMNENCD